MASCTFFGHREIPNKIEPALSSALIDLIENKNVNKFFVGNQGQCDSMVKNCLQKLKQVYPIEYEVVLAYIPKRRDEYSNNCQSDTMIPEGIEKVPRKFAIDYRNRWMVGQSDYVIAYVRYHTGGAAKYMEYAIKKKKVVINLGLL